jgi:hypothetical protein
MRKILEKLGMVKAQAKLPIRLRAWTEEDYVIFQVRSVLQRARDFYAARGRRILAMDLQYHLDFFDEAVKFDKLENTAMLLPTNTDKN